MSIFCLTTLFILFQNPLQAKNNDQGRYYIFSGIESIDEDITWSGIARLHQGTYFYFDHKNSNLSYFKWGFEMKHMLHPDRENDSYEITDGHLFGNILRKGAKDTLYLDNLTLGELNAGIPYRSVWVPVTKDNAKLKELQTNQAKELASGLNLLSILRQKVHGTGFKDYPGKYQILNQIEQTGEENMLSDAQIKLPLEKLNFRKNSVSFLIPNVEKVYLRRIRHLFSLSKGSDREVNAHQVTIRGNAFADSNVGIEIFEIQAPKEAIDWKNWRRNVVMSPHQILYAEENGLIFLSNDGTELLASYQYYDDKHKVHVVAASGKDSNDIEGITEAYSMIRTLNRDEHEGEILSMKSIISQSYDELSHICKEVPLINTKETNTTTLSEEFDRLEALFTENQRGYEKGRITLGNYWCGHYILNYYILKSETKEALYDLQMHDVTTNIDTLFCDKNHLVLALGEDPLRYIFRKVIPRNGLNYVFEKTVWHNSLHFPVELEAAAFFRALQQTVPKSLISSPDSTLSSS